jgi:hypothetical protein
LSLTVTVKVQVWVLPLASVAVTVTVEVPTGKVLPLAGEAALETPGQLSEEGGRVKDTTALHIPASLFWVMLAGQAATGGSLSLTVTVKVQEVEFPAASAAV